MLCNTFAPEVAVILALAPPQVHNLCHLNSHVHRTMLFDQCRAQADGEGHRRRQERQTKGKPMRKRPGTFLDAVFSGRPRDTRRKIAGYNESAKSGMDTASLETFVTPVANTTTKPPLTGMLMQFDGVTLCQPPSIVAVLGTETTTQSCGVPDRFLEKRHGYVNKAWPTALGEKPKDLVWSSGQPLDISS